MIDVRNTREKYGYGNIPQLIIYRINKGDKQFEIKILNLELNWIFQLILLVSI